MLHRWREVIAAGLAGAAGLWLMWLGGYLLVPAGAAVTALAAGWAMIARALATAAARRSR